MIKLFQFGTTLPSYVFIRKPFKLFYCENRNIDGETVETVSDFIFLGSRTTADSDCSHEIKRRLLLGRKVMTNPRQHIQKQRHYFANKGPFSQGYGFSCGHVWM